MSIIRKNIFLIFPMNTARIFDIAFRSLLVFLPFSTFISVFFSQILHIP